MAEENNIYTPPSLVNGTVKFGNAEAITADVISAHNIQDLPDRPNAPTSYGGFSYSAKDLKERFEGLARLAINAINTLINELGAGTVSSNIKIPDWSKAPDPDNPSVTTLNTLVNAVQSGKLAEAIKVDSNDSGESDNEYDATLQAVLTTLLTKAKSLETSIGNGDLAKAIKVDTYDNASTLQAVLTVLTEFVTQLNYDITHGALAQNLKFTPIDEFAEIDTLESLSEAIRADNGKYLANYFEVPTNDSKDGEKRNLTDIIIELLHFKETRPATVYTPRGTATAIPNILDDEGNEVVSEGDVYSIEPEGEDSFLYNGKIYPSGTNMVYLGYYDEDDNPVWDSLGGIVDYKSLASNTPVKEYSGKTVLQDVLDILSTPWDLIITSPADLGKLSTASGNVLVRLEGEDNVIGTNDAANPYFKLGSGIRLLDLGGSTFASAHIEAVKSAETTIRNGKIAYGFLKNFGRVDNCKGIISTSDCTFVTNCVLRKADHCDYVVNCSTYPEDPNDISFNECNLISNLTVGSLEDGQGMPSGTVEFYNCHHISNVHCAEGAANAVRINYENCTYVDPYTCAGYVQTENVGKVPVPTAQGGVEFKEFATKTDIGNIEEALRILNEGSATE